MKIDVIQRFLTYFENFNTLAQLVKRYIALHKSCDTDEDLHSIEM